MSSNIILRSREDESEPISISALPLAVEPAKPVRGGVTCFGGPNMSPAEEAWERLYRMSAEERAHLNQMLAAAAEQHGPSGQ